jgi:hypothetical protein
LLPAQVMSVIYMKNLYYRRHLELGERSFVNQWQKSCLKTEVLPFCQKIPLGMTRQRECRQTILFSHLYVISLDY